MSKPGREQDETGSVQTFARACKLLRIVAGKKNEGASLSELVRASGLTKPTTRRMLIAMIEQGFVEQTRSDSRYYIGVETFSLGVLAASRFGIGAEALKSVRRLARQSDDAAMLSIRNGNFTTCTHREDGNYPLKTHVLQPGHKHPLGVSAAGLALLAALPDDEVNSTIEQNLPRIRQDYPEISEGAVRAEVLATRQRGYSLNPGLVVSGSWGVAVIVNDVLAARPLALTIAAVQSRFADGRLEQLGKMLLSERDRLHGIFNREKLPNLIRNSGLSICQEDEENAK
jgi:DNA-binding IclR family transcriptional regulator